MPVRIYFAALFFIIISLTTQAQPIQWTYSQERINETTWKLSFVGVVNTDSLEVPGGMNSKYKPKFVQDEENLNIKSVSPFQILSETSPSKAKKGEQVYADTMRFQQFIKIEKVGAPTRYKGTVKSHFLSYRKHHKGRNLYFTNADYVVFIRDLKKVDNVITVGKEEKYERVVLD